MSGWAHAAIYTATEIIAQALFWGAVLLAFFLWSAWGFLLWLAIPVVIVVAGLVLSSFFSLNAIEQPAVQAARRRDRKWKVTVGVVLAVLILAGAWLEWASS